MSYWLVKTEEDVYPIHQLKKDKHTLWDGVRNYQARNFLKEMEPGDLVFVYHSNAEEVGIVGLAEVASTAVPDPLQFKKNSKYYDEKASKEAPRWFCPKLKFKELFSGVIPLSTLKEKSFMEGSALTRKGNRLSVMPIENKAAKGILKLANSKLA